VTQVMAAAPLRAWRRRQQPKPITETVEKPRRRTRARRGVNSSAVEGDRLANGRPSRWPRSRHRSRASRSPSARARAKTSAAERISHSGRITTRSSAVSVPAHRVVLRGAVKRNSRPPSTTARRGEIRHQQQRAEDFAVTRHISSSPRRGWRRDRGPPRIPDRRRRR
jgi:hypothetical protein